MTGGVAVILGPTGDNFAAGMTGGMGFVLDADGRFEQRVNPDSVVWRRIAARYWETLVLSLIEEHVAETGSAYARQLLSKWDSERLRFWQVCPKEMIPRLKHPMTDAETEFARA
jgi:glutamate synthase (NADPH/NADH) large chain